MPALPSASAFTASSVSEGEFKTQITALIAYLNGILGSAGTQPAALTALGSLLNGTIAKTAAYTVVAADRGKLIDCSGTWTLAIDAIATLEAGFAFAAINSGTGVITINPDLSELINDELSLTLGPLESCVVLPNAAASGWLAIKSVSTGLLQRTVLTSGTSHNYHPDTTHVIVEGVGGGAGGGAAGGTYGCSGGGGGYFRTSLLPKGVGSSMSFAIGAGGGGGGNGGNSTATIDGVTYTAYGGAATGAGGSWSSAAGGSCYGRYGGAGGPDAFAGGESAFSTKALAADCANPTGVRGGGGVNGFPNVCTNPATAGGAGMIVITEFKYQ